MLEDHATPQKHASREVIRGGENHLTRGPFRPSVRKAPPAAGASSGDSSRNSRCSRQRGALPGDGGVGENVRRHAAQYLPSRRLRSASDGCFAPPEHDRGSLPGGKTSSRRPADVTRFHEAADNLRVNNCPVPSSGNWSIPVGQLGVAAVRNLAGSCTPHRGGLPRGNRTGAIGSPRSTPPAFRPADQCDPGGFRGSAGREQAARRIQSPGWRQEGRRSLGRFEDRVQRHDRVASFIAGGLESATAIVGKTRHATVAFGRQNVDEFPLRNCGCRKTL